MTRLFAPAILAVGLLAAHAAPALAHAHLQTAMPAAGGLVKAAPSQISLAFSEQLEPKLCTVEITDPTGKRVDSADLHLAPGDDKRLLVGLTPSGPGTYRVSWHVVSTDTHRTEGHYSFTVAP